MNALGEEIATDFGVSEIRGRDDGRIDLAEEFEMIGQWFRAKFVGDLGAPIPIGIDNPDQLNIIHLAGKIRMNPPQVARANDR
jgi:hypothetical protein